jgi:hypothetical protein
MRWPVAGLLFYFLAGPTLAQVQANIGVLTCTLAQSGEEEASPPSQTRAMVCSFKPEGTGPEEQYSGEIRKVGSSTSLTGTSVLMWVVVGPADAKLAPGLLQQSYVGTHSPPPEAEWEPPVMLVGEENDDFALRPMTDSFMARKDAEGAASSVTVVVLKVKSAPA